MHNLLKRQLKKIGLGENELPTNLEQWNSILTRISIAYQNADQERYLLERSLDISSREMKERWNENSELLLRTERYIKTLDFQNESLKKISQNHSLEDLFLSLLKAASDGFNSIGGSIYTVSNDKKELTCKTTYNLPNDYIKETANIPIQKDLGSCGSSSFLKKPVYTKSVYKDECWKDFVEIVSKTEIVACWSTPILNTKNELLGTMALYFDKEVLPNDSEIEQISKNVQILVIALEKKISQELLEKEQLNTITNSKKAALGEMAGGIAHEINNPLTILNGYSIKLEILAKKNQLNTENIKEITSGIKSTVDRISKIINALRIYSREDEKNPYENHSLNKIIQDSLILCSEKIKNAGISLEWKEVESDIYVNCNNIQIEQVIINLLSNSYDAINKLKSPWIKINTVTAGKVVKIVITDCGSGIPDNIRDKIMQPFFTTKEVGKGTGLGLSISHGICAEHGGKLEYNQNSKNTEFIIILPVSSKDKLNAA